MKGRFSDGFAELVAATLKERGENPFSLERRLKFPEAAVRSIVKKLSVPSIDRAQEICDALGLEFYIGLPRDRPGQEIELGADTFVTVPLYEPTASAGPGDVVEGEAVLGQVAFRRAWLRRHGIAPDQAALFRVRGHSMAPTIPDRAVVLVDRAARQLRDRRVYVLRQDGALFLKRLSRDRRGNVIAGSDNPAIDPFLLDPSLGDAPLVGEVRWFGMSLS